MSSLRLFIKTILLLGSLSNVISFNSSEAGDTYVTSPLLPSNMPIFQKTIPSVDFAEITENLVKSATVQKTQDSYIEAVSSRNSDTTQQFTTSSLSTRNDALKPVASEGIMLNEPTSTSSSIISSAIWLLVTSVNIGLYVLKLASCSIYYSMSLFKALKTIFFASLSVLTYICHSRIWNKVSQVFNENFHTFFILWIDAINEEEQKSFYGRLKTKLTDYSISLDSLFNASVVFITLVGCNLDFWALTTVLTVLAWDTYYYGKLFLTVVSSGQFPSIWEFFYSSAPAQKKGAPPSQMDMATYIASMFYEPSPIQKTSNTRPASVQSAAIPPASNVQNTPSPAKSAVLSPDAHKIDPKESTGSYFTFPSFF